MRSAAKWRVLFHVACYQPSSLRDKESIDLSIACQHAYQVAEAPVSRVTVDSGSSFDNSAIFQPFYELAMNGLETLDRSVGAVERWPSEEYGCTPSGSSLIGFRLASAVSDNEVRMPE